MNQHLRGLVDWLEGAHLRGRATDSDFEQSVPPHVLAWTERALDLALSSQCPVVLYTRSVSAHALVSALVFSRAGIQLEDVYNQRLTDAEFDRLATTLAQINRSGLRIAEGWPSASIAEYTLGDSYVFLC